MFDPKTLLIGVIWISTVISQDQGPRVTLNEGLGVLEGKRKMTVGNLGVDPKEYYIFRNIPYAHMVSGENRYKQATKWTDVLGDDANPWDATKNGPLCFQQTFSEAQFNFIMASPIRALVEDFVQDIMDLRDDVSEELSASDLTDYLFAIIESLTDFVADGTMTTYEFFDEWMDMSLSTSEECLHLAVSTPRDPSNNDLVGDLPVMFWIHGGAFSGGWGENANDLARLGDVADVVLVAINYRVGPLGFTCLDTDEAAGNMGMLDMVEALKWVQTHIEKFGGDPTKVTIFGESAGSASIGHLVLSPSTEGLFAQGIGQSGSALSPWAFDQTPDFHARNIASNAGCTDEDPDTLVDCLRTKPPEEIFSAFRQYEKSERLDGKLGFGGVIPCAQTKGNETFYSAGDDPETLLVEGNYRDLPIFFGANSHEGTYVYAIFYDDFIEPNGYEEDSEFLADGLIETILRGIFIDQPFAVRDLVNEYHFLPGQLGNFEAMVPGLIDFLGSFFLKSSSYAMVEYNSDRAPSYWYSVEHKNQKKSMYNFIFLGDLWQAKYVPEPGVSHADELVYMFDARLPLMLCNVNELLGDMIQQINLCYDDVACVSDPSNAFIAEWGECFTGELTREEQVWSDRIVRAWTNFAIYGNPVNNGEGGLPVDLPPWTRDNPAYLAFTANGAVVAEDYTTTYNAVMLEESVGDVGGDEESSGGLAPRFALWSVLLSSLAVSYAF